MTVWNKLLASIMVIDGKWADWISWFFPLLLDGGLA